MSERRLRWSDFDQHIRGEHFRGKPVKLTISHVSVEVLHPGGREAKTPTLYFRETQKDLPLSNVNRHQLMEWFGDDPDACVGKVVTLEAVSAKVGGKSKLPVRITAWEEAKANGKVENAPTAIGESDFDKVVHDLNIDAKTAHGVRLGYTVAGQTDWARAINELMARAKE